MLDPVSALWTTIGISVVAFIAVRAWLWRRTPRESSLGTVSDHWLAEQRQNRPDSQR